MPAALGLTAAVDGGGLDGVVGGTPKVTKGRSHDRRYRATTGGVIEEIIRLHSEGLSTRRIGDATGMDRQAVTRILHKAGVHLALRGAGRARPTARLPERADLAEVLRDLYLLRRFTRAQVARELRISESEVRTGLRSYGIRTRSRGWANREDRLQVDFDELEELYVERDLSADRVGEQMGTSRHTVLRAAHELGFPVRLGGVAPPRHGPAGIELIQALYSDPLVADAVRRHRLPIRAAGSPIWVRFPEPVRLTRGMLVELYVEWGLSTQHIELLTGQPSGTVLNRLRRWGVPLRTPGGRSPFRVRWRNDQRAQERQRTQRPRGAGEVNSRSR